MVRPSERSRADVDEPAHAERQRAIRADVDGHLVGRATDAAGLHLDLGLHVAERAFPDLDRIVLRLLGDESNAP